MPKKKRIPIATFVSHETIERKIYLIRGRKVMLDSELAELYEVRTNVLSKAVGRNLDRFPEDFMFQLSKEEAENLRLQNGVSSWGGRRYLPRVFTDYGILMLSSVLNSKRAIHVNIQIMRTFAKHREMLGAHKDLKERIDELEKKYDSQFQVVFKAVKLLLDEKPGKGFDGKRFEIE
jgi:hypothetical protein